jgi:hypothetical protein
MFTDNVILYKYEYYLHSYRELLLRKIAWQLSICKAGNESFQQKPFPISLPVWSEKGHAKAYNGINRHKN